MATYTNASGQQVTIEQNDTGYTVTDESGDSVKYEADFARQIEEDWSIKLDDSPNDAALGDSVPGADDEPEGTVEQSNQQSSDEAGDRAGEQGEQAGEAHMPTQDAAAEAAPDDLEADGQTDADAGAPVDEGSNDQPVVHGDEPAATDIDASATGTSDMRAVDELVANTDEVVGADLAHGGQEQHVAQDSETIDPQASLSEDDDLANSTAPASADAGHQSFDQLDPVPAVEEAGQQATVAMLSGDLGDLGVSGGK